MKANPSLQPPHRVICNLVAQKPLRVDLAPGAIRLLNCKEPQ